MKLSSFGLYGLLIGGVLSACDKGSWVADDGREDYTSTADSTQLVFHTSVEGPALITITQPRTQSWTSTLGPSVTYQDALNLNPKWAEFFNETITEATELGSSVEIRAGQVANVGFTSFLRCSKGRTVVLTMQIDTWKKHPLTV